MAAERGLASDALVPAELWTDDDTAPPRLVDVLSQVAHFLDRLGYTKTLKALCREAGNGGLAVDVAAWERGIQGDTAVPLLAMYEEWFEGNAKFPTVLASHDAEDDEADDSEGSSSEEDSAEGALVDVEAEETSDDDSDEDSSDSKSSDGDGSDSESDGDDGAPASAGGDLSTARPKRKRASTPSSSSSADSSDEPSSASSDDEDSSDSDDGAPPTKKAKLPDADAGAEETSSASDAASSSESASSESSDEDDSESDAEQPSQLPPPQSTHAARGAGAKTPADGTVGTGKDTGSTSSATLDGEPAPEDRATQHVHPDRLKRLPGSSKKEQAAERRTQQVPFSRIPADQAVDPRFASNDYVSYDYADRAYRDLSVTKGKGFTKEKNKKKRGSYRGGAIDLTPKGIKFDD